MGILVNAASIACGGVIGGFCKQKARIQNNNIFGIAIMLISAIGLIENMFDVSDSALRANHITSVVLAFIIGSTVGERIGLGARLQIKGEGCKRDAFVEATLFFAIGGMQICGPLLLALRHDNSQLYLKSMIDFPFAVLLGGLRGKVVSLSSLPVAAMQIIIAAIAMIFGEIISETLLSQLCSVGYVILFFSGFNMIVEEKHRIDNINMLPTIPLLIFFNFVF